MKKFIIEDDFFQLFSEAKIGVIIALDINNETEVEEYLAMVVRSMEELIQVNIDTTAKIKEVEAELERYKAMEKTINEAMILAEKTCEDMIRNAEEKVKFLLERAEEQAKKTINDASNEVLEVVKKQESAKQELLTFQTKFKILLESQLQLVNDHITQEKQVDGQQAFRYNKYQM